MSSSEKKRQWLSKIDHGFEMAEAFILSSGVLIMAVNTIANVFGRYVFNQSIYFTEELNEFLIVIITFMGLSYATRKGRHIRMSAVYDMLPDLSKKILMICISVLTAIMMFILAWYAFEYVAKIARRGRVTPALQIPLYITYIWVVAGFALTGIQYLLAAIKNLNFDQPEVYISYTTIDEYEDPELSEVLHLYEQGHETHNTANDNENGENKS